MNWFLDIWKERRWAGPDDEYRIRVRLFGLTFTVWSWYE